MATFSSKYNVRSISLPSRSHPITIKIEKHLRKLKLWETKSFSNSDQVCNGLFVLGELYKCIDGLLNLSMIQQAISRHQNNKWVSEWIDGSIKYLDTCSKTKDAVVLMNEHVRELQSTLRRSKSDTLTIIQQNLKIFNCHRKQMKRDLSKSIHTLKHMERNKFGSSTSTTIIDTENLLSVVIRVFTEANTITISIIESLVMFLSKPKATKWSLVSKLMHKGSLVSSDGNQEENKHGLEHIDIALNDMLVHDLPNSAENIQSTHKKLQDLELSMEGIENGLDGLFKNLIHTRVSLLNILSQ